MHQFLPSLGFILFIKYGVSCLCWVRSKCGHPVRSFFKGDYYRVICSMCLRSQSGIGLSTAQTIW